MSISYYLIIFFFRRNRSDAFSVNDDIFGYSIFLSFTQTRRKNILKTS